APSAQPPCIIGLTGPPGAGKSSLVDAWVAVLVAQQQRVAVLCVDPSSPMHSGALLGDRIRMSRWYNEPQVYIRSLSSRGALGGLNPAVTDILKFLSACPFDRIIIETVGVGQSEVEVARLADLTVLVMVPESGDEVQFMKAGLIEMADLFVVNKSDRPGVDLFTLQLKNSVHDAKKVVNTIAVEGVGMQELDERVQQQLTKKNKLL
ncbi:MAG: ArgK/MeaB family GTPase, partial [Bacteroidota bacterium]